jgi:hypothetical protein
VPHYKWLIKKPTNIFGTANIFGSEDNNWYTEVYISVAWIFYKKYQDLDFTTPNEKYRTNLTRFGYLASFDINGDPLPITNPVVQGAPSTSPQLKMYCCWSTLPLLLWIK